MIYYLIMWRSLNFQKKNLILEWQFLCVCVQFMCVCVRFVHLLVVCYLVSSLICVFNGCLFERLCKCEHFDLFCERDLVPSKYCNYYYHYYYYMKSLFCIMLNKNNYRDLSNSKHAPRRWYNNLQTSILLNVIFFFNVIHTQTPVLVLQAMYFVCVCVNACAIRALGYY